MTTKIEKPQQMSKNHWVYAGWDIVKISNGPLTRDGARFKIRRSGTERFVGSSDSYAGAKKLIVSGRKCKVCKEPLLWRTTHFCSNRCKQADKYKRDPELYRQKMRDKRAKAKAQ